MTKQSRAFTLCCFLPVVYTLICMLSAVPVCYFAVPKNNVFMPSSFCQSPTGNSDSEPGEQSRPLLVFLSQLKGPLWLKKKKNLSIKNQTLQQFKAVGTRRSLKLVNSSFCSLKDFKSQIILVILKVLVDSYLAILLWFCPFSFDCCPFRVFTA